MARPVDPAVFDNAIKRYLAGEPEQQILTALGIGCTTFHRERSRRGIPPRNTLILPEAEIAAAYLAGESEYSLGLRYGVSRSVIRIRIERQGAAIRGTSAAGKVRAGKMTASERKHQAAAAHAAARGAKQSYEHLVKRALANEARGRFASAGERQLAAWLSARGLNPLPQKAVDKYNVDLAVAPVAVEVLGGGWHLEKRSHSIRTPCILDAGWHMAFVWDHEGDSALGEDAADYAVAFVDEMRRNPAARGQYRVISGSGQLLTAGSRDDGQFALVPPPRGRARART